MNQQNQQNQIANQFNVFKRNPIQFLSSRGMNIPSQYQNNPKGIVQSMLNSGQMSQDQYNRLVGMAQNMGIKLE